MVEVRKPVLEKLLLRDEELFVLWRAVRNVSEDVDGAQDELSRLIDLISGGDCVSCTVARASRSK